MIEARGARVKICHHGFERSRCAVSLAARRPPESAWLGRELRRGRGGNGHGIGQGGVGKGGLGRGDG